MFEENLLAAGVVRTIMHVLKKIIWRLVWQKLSCFVVNHFGGWWLKPTV